MNRYKPFLIWATVALIIAFSILNAVLLLKLNNKYDSGKQNVKDNSKKITDINSKFLLFKNRIDSIRDQINSLKEQKSKAGATGPQGNPGPRGKDGSDSTNKKTIINNHIPVNGKDGVDGLTPILRCNTIKNRWEYKYIGDLAWNILNGEPVKCMVE